MDIGMSRNTIRLLVLAAIALGLGIYVMLGGSGNDTVDSVSGDAACSITHAKSGSVEAAAQGHVAAYRSLEAPVDLTNLVFNDRDGNQTGIQSWSGRTVLLNLWATWCVPCREEMPALDKLQEIKGNERFEVVPVSIDLDSDKKPKDFYSEIELSNLGFFHDGTSDIFFDLKKRGIAFGMPATILIDEKGCGIGVLNGAADWSSKDALKLIDAAIALSEAS